MVDLHALTETGKISTGGCIFCSEKGSGELISCANGTSQIDKIHNQVVNYFNSYKSLRADKFIAYFQNFTNTYDSIKNLKAKYDAALINPKIVGLEVATRPDCINEDIVKLLTIGIITVLLEKHIVVSSSSYEFNYFYLILCGFLMSIGVIVPGVSSTIILMLLGVYSAYLTSVSSVYLPILVPMGIGLIIGSLIFMKITKVLLNKFYAQTFYTIIGFTLGSIFVIWPEFTFDLNGIISFLCMMVGPILASFNLN